MNQDKLVSSVSEISGASKTQTESVLKALGQTVQAALATNNEVTLPGIGKLSVTVRAERNGRNPRTGEAIVIPAKKTPKFSAVKALKDATAG